MAGQFEAYRSGLASKGLQVFCQIAQAKDHGKLVELVELHITTYRYFIEKVLSAEMLYLEDDTVAETYVFSYDQEDSPPLAWVEMTEGVYYHTEAYGDEVPQNVKEAGCIFWDSERLVNTGAKTLLEYVELQSTW
jgi:hypothetical protein